MHARTVTHVAEKARRWVAGDAPEARERLFARWTDRNVEMTHLASFSEVGATLDRVDAMLPTLGPCGRELGTAFSRNLRSVVNAASLPFRFLAGAKARLRFQFLCFAEERRLGKAQSALTRQDVAGITAAALQAFREECGDQKKMATDVDWAESELQKDLGTPDYEYAYQDLLRQCLVMSWNSLEVLARDAFIAFSREVPDWCAPLARSDFGIRKFGKKACERVLAGERGDLSAELLDRLNFNNLDTIRACYALSVEPVTREAFTGLEAPLIELTYQRRHLIVHRRGVVDPLYLVETEEKLAIGTELVISSADLARTIGTTGTAGAQLLRAVSKALDHDPSPAGK